MNFAMKIILLIAVLSSSLFAAENFPQRPDPAVTPGSRCSSPTEYRYPEKIPYCKRSVSQADKADVFNLYRKRGYELRGPRDTYKIDHLIPLCAGGSNRPNNLWPQHQSIFGVTDMMEQVGCEKLKLGYIKQTALIDMILEGKNDLSKVPGILDELNRL